jgi:opacity protein-like surface antigen
MGSGLNDSQKVGSGVYNYNQGVISSIALGYQRKLWRFELEGDYKINQVRSSNSNSASGSLVRESKMFNVYYSGYNRTKLVSTIGLGAGLSDVKSKSLEVLNIPTDFTVTNIITYQGSFSVGYMLSKHLTLSAKYRYLTTIKKGILAEDNDNIFSVGLRYLF